MSAGRWNGIAPNPVEAAAKIVDDELRRMAEKAFNEALAQWEAKLANTETDLAARLREPEFVAGVGLPPDLPDFTVGILKHTMALDLVGDERPRRDIVYRKFGLATAE